MCFQPVECPRSSPWLWNFNLCKGTFPALVLTGTQSLDPSHLQQQMNNWKMSLWPHHSLQSSVRACWLSHCLESDLSQLFAQRKILKICKTAPDTSETTNYCVLAAVAYLLLSILCCPLPCLYVAWPLFENCFKNFTFHLKHLASF